VGEGFLAFFSFRRPKSKIENGYLFTKNFAWCLVPFYKNDGLKHKFFLDEMGK
jgi:hypothetical protein